MLICKKLKENVKYSEAKYTYIFIEETIKDYKYIPKVCQRKKETQRYILENKNIKPLP